MWLLFPKTSYIINKLKCKLQIQKLMYQVEPKRSEIPSKEIPIFYMSKAALTFTKNQSRN